MILKYESNHNSVQFYSEFARFRYWSSPVVGNLHYSRSNMCSVAYHIFIPFLFSPRFRYLPSFFSFSSASSVPFRRLSIAYSSHHILSSSHSFVFLYSTYLLSVWVVEYVCRLRNCRPFSGEVIFSPYFDPYSSSFLWGKKFIAYRCLLFILELYYFGFGALWNIYFLYCWSLELVCFCRLLFRVKDLFGNEIFGELKRTTIHMDMVKKKVWSRPIAQYLADQSKSMNDFNLNMTHTLLQKTNIIMKKKTIS